MNFVDTTLLRLSDPQTRAQVFDSTALEQMTAAAYDTDAMSVQGPYQPVFDEFQLGFGLPRLGTVEGTWNPVGGVEKVEARFYISGLGNGPPIRVDAIWRGQIVARAVPATGRIMKVVTQWPDLGTIDAEIVAALGALPAAADVLERDRRTRLLARIRAALNHPAEFTDTVFDDWMRSVGAASVRDLLTHYVGTIQPAGVQVTFSPPDQTPPSPKPLPIAAVLLIRDAGFFVADLLMESKILRERLDSLGLQRPPDRTLRLREPLLVLWIIPVAVFDDAGWPGGAPGMNADALRQARRAAAGKWLAQEGIGLVVTS